MFLLGAQQDYGSNEVKSVYIHLLNDINIHFEDVQQGQFWFMILSSTNFEGKTQEQIKLEFPEEFI